MGVREMLKAEGPQGKVMRIGEKRTTVDGVLEAAPFQLEHGMMFLLRISLRGFGVTLATPVRSGRHRTRFKPKDVVDRSHSVQSGSSRNLDLPSSTVKPTKSSAVQNTSRFEDGNHYSLAERQQFLRTYQSNWDSLVPQKTTNIPILHHRIYELAGGIYGFVPDSTPNSVRFYRLPSVSRGIEMEEWSVQDLDFPIDDFTMEEAYDLLTVFIYKTGQYVHCLLLRMHVHLLKLSDGKPHPRARKPLLEYEIPLNHTVHGWELEAVIWENKLGCLFTSTSANESVDALVIWDWTTGDLIRVLPQCGNEPLQLSFLHGSWTIHRDNSPWVMGHAMLYNALYNP
ncbi:hypothetical protein BJ322DRAFT_1219350 [Thelephora terrestris]|uniref:Uncharacterized protein n=1 Tax=Thelephora terrestris TaxID=56493 RepID=A0A9P6L5J9_9AGAM|nr:hypothetical protein BJ322DRAFT_1219350 [Thelephora terrestris]